MSAPGRYVAVLMFCAGMLVAGLLVPIATRSTDDTVATTTTGSPVEPGDTAAAESSAEAPNVDPSNADAATAATTATSVGATGTRAPSASAPTASDVGVTVDAIKVGVVLLDLSGASNLIGGLAGASADDQQAAIQAFVDEANAAGGVNGRKLVPVYSRYDPVSGDGNVNCNQLTEDAKVFAVLSMGLFGAPVLCVTQQHGAPLLSIGGFIDEYYARSRGLLFTFRPSKPRSARSGAFALDALGVLKGKKIGVFTSRAGDDDVAVDTGLVPALNQLGHEVVHISRLSADSTNSSEIPVEVNQMRAAGADVVFLQTNVVYDTQFVQQADSQAYRPLYLLSDSDDNVSDFFLSGMPANFKAIGISVNRTGEQRVGQPEAATDAGCRAVVEKATRASLARGSAGYETAMSACNMVRTLVRAARDAGTQLTRPAFSSAMQGIGAFPQAYAAGGSFRAGKFDAADLSRPLKADMRCSCWLPTGGFQPMHP